MRSEPSSLADDGRTLFDFAKPDVGLAWQPDHGGVPMTILKQNDQPQLWVMRGNPDAA